LRDGEMMRKPERDGARRGREFCQQTKTRDRISSPPPVRCLKHNPKTLNL
jgi:hypothetical protein